jgi:hypothetical protein
MFSNAGGGPASKIARWNGSAWSPLGLGLNGPVWSLAVSGTNLYVGGSFTLATNANKATVTVNRIALWNGNSWSQLGVGMGGSAVRVFAVDGGILYAGGTFTNAGGLAATNIAKWNGSAWSSLGLGLNKSISSLVVSRGDLYAGGSFDLIGGVMATNLARWDGVCWSAMGSGVDGSVKALTADGAGQLFVGGSFYWAGNKLSPYIAQANLIPLGGVVRSIHADGGVVTLSLLGRAGSTYTVRRAQDVRFTQNLTLLLTTNAPAPDGLFRCTDSNPPSTTAFYRLLKQ